MKWSKVGPTDLRKGDQIRVFKGEFNQLEATVEEINGDLYADGVGWFTDSDTDDEPDWVRRWDKVFRLNTEPKTPGTYIARDSYPPEILELTEGGTWLASNSIVTSGWGYIADRWAPLEHYYSEKEVQDLIAIAVSAVK